MFGQPPAPRDIVLYLPAAWTAIAIASWLVNKVRAGRIALPVDEKPRRPYFDWFIRDEDIVEALTDDKASHAHGKSEGPQRPHIDISPSLRLLTSLAAVFWFVVTIIELLSERALDPHRNLLSASYAFCWTAFAARLAAHAHHTPPFSLLVFAILLFPHGFISLLEAHPHPSWLLAPSLVFAAIAIGIISAMPLRAPLPVDDGDPSRPNSPEDTNSIIGSLTYSWMNPIMTLARKRALVQNDVWKLSLNNRAVVLNHRWNSLKSKTLLRRILAASSRDIVIDVTLKLVAVSGKYFRPFFVQKLLEVLSADHYPDYKPATQRRAYLFAILAFLSMCVKTLAEQQHFHHARRIGMRLRSEITVAVFEKALSRKNASGRITGASSGKVTSLIAEDTNRVLRMGCDAHLIYGAPLEIALAIIFLYNLMGWSALVGFSILVVAAPINYALGRMNVRITKTRSAVRDFRQATLQELLAAIRTVKLCGWSAPWRDKVENARRNELKWMLKEWLNSLAINFLWVFVGSAVPITSFICFTKVQGQQMTVAVAFTALALFVMVRNSLYQIPSFGIKILQTLVSTHRIESFFLEEDIENHAAPTSRASCERMALHGATLTWPTQSEQGPFRLTDIDFTFEPSTLTVVSGSTGSGKTSLLLSLLGELEVVSGSAELPTSVSFAAQHPWLETASVKSNILFGSPYLPDRYKQVIAACALEPDLLMLPLGEMTHIGERGVALSGGQKARVALARALYAPTDYVLLDDVLAAVDSHTATHLFRHALTGPILQGRTCVLVTHHTRLLMRGATHFIELSHGRVVRSGAIEAIPASAPRSADASRSASRTPSVVDEQQGVAKDEEEAVVDDQASLPIETWSTGAVKLKMYAAYLRASSYSLWLLIVLFSFGEPALSFVAQFWLRRWGEDPKADVNYFLLGYAAMTFGTSLIQLTTIMTQYAASLRASRILFSSLLLRVMHAPLRWFDITPVGRIVNRFTNDVAIIDESLAADFVNFLSQLVGMSASLLVTSAILPSALVTTLAIAVMYGFYFARYLSVVRDLNRIASTTASPIFSKFEEALNGITTIRAFSKEAAYKKRLCELVDDTLSFWYATCTLAVWLSFRTQLLSALCLLSTACLAIQARVSPGIAGIAIHSSFTLIAVLDMLCNSYGNLGLDLNALERVTEYLELPQEPSDGEEPPATWPTDKDMSGQGCIARFENVTLSYASELRPVLYDVSFDVRPRERVAIAGRTGSGKSTLAMSLLRFVDPVAGTITIDGLDISTVDIETLRQRITYLPQDAVLFAGSVRSNLDPFDTHSDAECHDALRRVHLSISLDEPVSGGGHSLSAGQRQLVALARALLRRSPLIVFDEASAGIDFELDTRIQQTIREEMNESALVTIAHRLRTIIDYDRILVLEQGKVVEFETPAALLARPEGVFHGLCRESGDYEELVALVEKQGQQTANGGT